MIDENKQNWIEEMRLINESKKKKSNESRFLNYLVKENIIDKSYLDWEIKDNIVEYWRRKRESRGEHSFDKKTGKYTGIFSQHTLNG
jgi:hypothetical protein